MPREHRDVVVVKVETINHTSVDNIPPINSTTPSATPVPQPSLPSAPIIYAPSITINALPGCVIVRFAPKAIRTCDQVLVGNDVLCMVILGR